MTYKNIPHFPGYQISRDGLALLSPNGRLIRPSAQIMKGKSTGYLYATLKQGFRQKRVAIHRLVAFAWLSPALPGQIWINHKDGNKSNNQANNLEWGTISDNIKHAYKTGLKVAGRHLAGKSPSSETRAKMSQAKKGAKHPRFKGFYVVSGQRFATPQEAAEGLHIHARTIARRCKSGKYAGFSFEPSK
jgi:hypothetical protein